MIDTKVAIITGASQGLGAGIVEAYLGLGYKVVANSRTIAESTNPDVVAVPGDVADPATAQAIVDAALTTFGRIDTLINNAGIFIAKPFTEYTAEDFSRILGTNVAGFYNLTQRVITPMLETGGGHIVNITTTLVEHASSAVPSVLASLTKGGLSAAIRSLAIEYAARGIRANAVSPGLILTPMHAGTSPEDIASMHPMNQAGTVEDIVRGIVYLEQAPFVTGEVLHVDGGQSAGH